MVTFHLAKSRAACRPFIDREPSYARRIGLMVQGLRKPRQTREYKLAVIEAQRLSAPLTAFLLPVLVVCLISLLTAVRRTSDDIPVLVTVSEPDTSPVEWEDPKEASSPARPDAFDFTLDIATPDVRVNDVRVDTPAAAAGIRPPAGLADPRTINMPVIPLSALARGRTAAMRNALREQSGGTGVTEDAVMRALRWLKKNQQSDGAWPHQRVAMTGLAVLTFLAHGEKPGASAEFGATTRRALEFLLRNQKTNGHFNGVDGNEYAHPIAAYALCEAYAMTLNPNVKTAAERALAPIIQGQHPSGGWTYKMAPGADTASGKYRNDTSYMGWCVQALKSAKLAGLHADGLDRALKLAVRGFKQNARPEGGFGYVGPGAGGLTGVGTLCLQLLGAAAEPAVKKSLDVMAAWEPSFGAKGPIGNSLQYYFYYATQAKFHAGGKRWDQWNTVMKTVYVNAQQIERNAVRDAQGCACDVGWWTNGDTHSDRPVMDTCLAALQLMVYYRYLPTTRAQAVRTETALVATAAETGDIEVDSGTL